MPLSISSAGRQLSDGNTVGTVLGTSINDLIGFYGVTTPVAQTAGNAQAALARGVAAGVIATGASSQSPPSVSANTSLESALVLYATTQAGTGNKPYDIASGDFLFVNKPTQQAGLGMGNVRVSSAANAGITFYNVSTAAISPTAGEVYGIVGIRGLATITAVLTPASVATSTTVEQIFSVPGLRVGEVVAVSKPTRQAALDIVGSRVAGAGLLGITFINCGIGAGTGAVTPTAGESYSVFSTGGLDSVSNVIGVAVNCGSPAVSVVSTTSERAFTMTGLAATDIVMGVSKTTSQAGVGIVGGRTSAANILAVNYITPLAAVSPTTYEVYGVTIYRPAPAAPIVNYALTVTPAAVGPNSTTSQNFTLTGVIASSMIWVNKPTYQVGLGIAGCRVSSTTNIIQIDYVNNTAATITPTAGEVYSIANFQQAIPDVGNTWIYSVTPQLQQGVLLQNAIRAAMVGMGLIAGA